jgi:hypothetical protein
LRWCFVVFHPSFTVAHGGVRGEVCAVALHKARLIGENTLR